MFRRMIPAAAIVASLGWAVSFAQQKIDNPDLKSKVDAKAAPKAEAKGNDETFELRMTDDTVMKVVLLDTSVSLATKYGKLVIPTADLRRLEFGFRYPEGIEAKIDKAVAELG
jgi:hypothetical protein